MGYNHHRQPNPGRELPTPPEGLELIGSGGALHEINRRRGEVAALGIRVWAEGEWKLVVGIRGRYHRTVEVDYADSKLPSRTLDDVGFQRVSVDRIAMPPELIPSYARRVEPEPTPEPTPEPEPVEVPPMRPARSTMTPEERLRSDLVLAELLLESREEELEAAHARVAAARGRIAELTEQLARLAPEEGTS